MFQISVAGSPNSLLPLVAAVPKLPLKVNCGNMSACATPMRAFV